ncbi:RICIN domain-containing protein [Dictyobacter formicarum]|uniref:Ricin B lectin domain-containing protein n=1 Tax=Dictyobacter formicarum TaxID=2778368 RepID=A0ABQ3VQF4_9CHLR|nr:RICIN domain-containing protein [Dictyobacter formicarum]GHO87618.1 hypothetical protein KSZ_56240 [Dictyobacter formicarum]
MSNQFLEATFNGGLRVPHYFNGRLLSAEELQTDQQAVLTRQGWLGQASGYGVIDGLVASQLDSSSIKVTSGSGLNRQGQLIRLPNDITLALPLQNTPQQPVNDTGGFSICTAQSVQPGAASATITAGAYVLTALLTSHLEGLAPTQFTATNDIRNGTSNATHCGSQWEVEGIQFKIIRLAGFDTVSGVNDTNRRALLAQWCYGSEVLPDLALDPFHFPDTVGGLDLLDPADLTPYDLPLAVFYWTGSALSFVDAWLARRRLIRPGALISTPETTPSTSGMPPDNTRSIQSPLQRVPLLRTWTGLLSDKREATAQARFLQFQGHIQQLIDDKKASTVAMKDYFRFLPPVGFVPVTLDSLLNLVGPPTSSLTGAGIQTSSQATPDPFLDELRSLLLARLVAEGSAGNFVNRGENGFSYATFFDSHQYFWIRTRMTTNFVMDVKESNKQSGTQVISFPRNTPLSDNQLWYFEGGYIVSKLTGFVLTASHVENLPIPMPSVAPPAPATQSTSAAPAPAAQPSNVISVPSPSAPQILLTADEKKEPQSSDQQWSIDADGCLVSKSNGFVADIYYAQPAPITPIIAYPKNSQLIPNQRWYLDPYVPDPAAHPLVPFVVNQAIVDGAAITSLMQQACYDDAIDIAQFYNPQQAPFPALNTYFVRESLVNPSSPLYIMFTRARRPFTWAIPPQ